MIRENLNILEEKISAACEKVNRRRSEIKLIAVSKSQNKSKIEEAFNAGINDFGENKAQELRDKASEINLKLTWHFIGHLQTNKVKYAIDPAEYIHSLDSQKLADEIDKKAGLINKIQKVLIEVNTAQEDAKYGLIDESEIFSLTEHCSSLQNIDLKGLMTMAPFTGDEKIIRESFKRLGKLLAKINNHGYNLTELSMGMTNDFEIAIEEGSTMLRIGTAIFGERLN